MIRAGGKELNSLLITYSIDMLIDAVNIIENYAIDFTAYDIRFLDIYMSLE